MSTRFDAMKERMRNMQRMFPTRPTTRQRGGYAQHSSVQRATGIGRGAHGTTLRPPSITALAKGRGVTPR